MNESYMIGMMSGMNLSPAVRHEGSVDILYSPRMVPLATILVTQAMAQALERNGEYIVPVEDLRHPNLDGKGIVVRHHLRIYSSPLKWFGEDVNVLITDDVKNAQLLPADVLLPNQKILKQAPWMLTPKSKPNARS